MAEPDPYYINNQPKQTVPLSSASTQQFNGIHSTNSSRDVSPITTRFNQIPSNQLPPGLSIPQSQLPPTASKTGMNLLTQKTATLSVNSGNALSNPIKYNTSTPNELNTNNNSGLISSGSAFSPINPVVSNLRSEIPKTTTNDNEGNNNNKTTPLRGDLGHSQVPKNLFDQGTCNNLPATTSQLNQARTLPQTTINSGLMVTNTRGNEELKTVSSSQYLSQQSFQQDFGQLQQQTNSQQTTIQQQPTVSEQEKIQQQTVQQQQQQQQTNLTTVQGEARSKQEPTVSEQLQQTMHGSETSLQQSQQPLQQQPTSLQQTQQTPIQQQQTFLEQQRIRQLYQSVQGQQISSQQPPIGQVQTVQGQQAVLRQQTSAQQQQSTVLEQQRYRQLLQYVQGQQTIAEQQKIQQTVQQQQTGLHQSSIQQQQTLAEQQRSQQIQQSILGHQTSLQQPTSQQQQTIPEQQKIPQTQQTILEQQRAQQLAQTVQGQQTSLEKPSIQHQRTVPEQQRIPQFQQSIQGQQPKIPEQEKIQQMQPTVLEQRRVQQLPQTVQGQQTTQSSIQQQETVPEQQKIPQLGNQGQQTSLQQTIQQQKINLLQTLQQQKINLQQQAILANQSVEQQQALQSSNQKQQTLQPETIQKQQTTVQQPVWQQQTLLQQSKTIPEQSRFQQQQTFQQLSNQNRPINHLEQMQKQQGFQQFGQKQSFGQQAIQQQHLLQQPIQQQQQQRGMIGQIQFNVNSNLEKMSINPNNVPNSINNFNLMSQSNAGPILNQNVTYSQTATTNSFPQQSGINSPNKPSLHSNRYPVMGQTQQQNFNQPQQPQQQINYNKMMQPQFQQQLTYQQQSGNYPEQSNITRTGFNKLWGYSDVDLLQNTNVLPRNRVIPPQVYLGQEQLDKANCSKDIFRCTLTKIPESNQLLQKSRLPLGVLIHPFKDLTNLPVIQCNVIVRCRACRTYINPFVYFIDNKRWKCNLCYRINELPEEFQYDPITKTYGDPSRRPEIKASTIEYIAPAEYMLRPPQPAVYLFLFDVSRFAVESNYLTSVCNLLLDELKNLPGDSRRQIGIITYDSYVHFFQLNEETNRPHELTVLDIDDIFLPSPENLLVNLEDGMSLIVDLLTQLPLKYQNSFDNNSALGAALQAGHKMMSATGGRITVFQTVLPNLGPGALTVREDPNQRGSNIDVVTNLNPANDFYKRLALECSGQQIAVDLFILNSQYVDLATISGISRFSGGCIYHFPLYNYSKSLDNERFEKSFRRYLTRKIGFEAVMRIRCTRGLSIHTFHGNFFVRSTDLLSLPNINPDAGFGMQLAIDENLSDVQSVCFQAALLYTSSKGERRIRVHTLCLPVCNTINDVINSADQQCIIGLLAKMAVDRSIQSNLSDAREAFINVVIDILNSYKIILNIGNGINGLIVPQCLILLPLYISALLKFVAFRIGFITRIDDRVKAMIDMKTKPLKQLIQLIYPDLYPIHRLDNELTTYNVDNELIPLPPHLQLTSRCLDSNGAYLMDFGEHIIILICSQISIQFLNDVLGVKDYNSIKNDFYELPVLNNSSNQRLHQFIDYLNDDKPFIATLHIIRDNSPNRLEFFERLIEDRVENALSYHEFLQHLKSQIK